MHAHARQVMSSVRELPWDGYSALIADIFRHRGHDVFAGDGPDGDVIDLELFDGEARLIVNYQLRGMRQISIAPLQEMAIVGERNGATQVLLITDGDFSPEAHRFAADHSLTLVDGDALLELVLDLTLKRSKAPVN